MSNNPTGNNKHRWRFFRSGGFDQVALETADDLRNLADLDPKLWTALNCPTTGLEFDARTLALLDTDGDGQIRVPEILGAVRWTCQMLKDPQVLFDGAELALDSIDDSHPEGVTLKAAAARVLEYLGKYESGRIGVADFADMTRLFSPDHPNGDGVAPAELTDDAALQTVIGEIVATQGGVPDRSGEPGISAETLAAFFEQATALLTWRKEAADSAEAIMPLGAATAAAAEALTAVETKLDDYFARCRLAAFDARAAEALNPPATVYGALGERPIAAEDADVAALPLAAIAAGRPLPLGEGVNPAWTSRLARFQDAVVKPLLGARESLTPEDWAAVSAKLVAYRAWHEAQPESSVRDLDPAYLAKIAGDDTCDRLAALIALDLEADTSAAKIDAV